MSENCRNNQKLPASWHQPASRLEVKWILWKVARNSHLYELFFPDGYVKYISGLRETFHLNTNQKNAFSRWILLLLSDRAESQRRFVFLSLSFRTPAAAAADCLSGGGWRPTPRWPALVSETKSHFWKVGESDFRCESDWEWQPETALASFVAHLFDIRPPRRRSGRLSLAAAASLGNKFCLSRRVFTQTT